MKVLLRHALDGCYYASPGIWTLDVDQAHNFERGAMAIAAAFDQRLECVEVVYEFPDCDPRLRDTPTSFSVELSTPNSRPEKR
jgi:hypothetical protein